MNKHFIRKTGLSGTQFFIDFIPITPFGKIVYRATQVFFFITFLGLIFAEDRDLSFSVLPENGFVYVFFAWIGLLILCVIWLWMMSVPE